MTAKADCDTRGQVSPVPADLGVLVEAIRLRLKPQSVSIVHAPHAAATRVANQWELLVELPADADPDLHDPILGWLIQAEAGVPATILTATSRGPEGRASQATVIWSGGANAF